MNIDTMCWEQADRTSAYLLQCLQERYEKVVPGQQLKEFLEKNYGSEAFKNKLRDDRYRIITVDSAGRLSGVMLMHWGRSKVMIDPAYKPQRKATLELMVRKATSIAGIWGFNRISCYLFAEEKKLARDLGALGFKATPGKLSDTSLPDHPRLEWTLEFEPVGAVTTL